MEDPPFRPTLSMDMCVPGIEQLMIECLAESPRDRPDVNIIKHKLKQMRK